MLNHNGKINQPIVLLLFALLFHSCDKGENTVCKISTFDYAFGDWQSSTYYFHSGNKIDSMYVTTINGARTGFGGAKISYDEKGRIFKIVMDEENYVNVSYSDNQITAEQVGSSPGFTGKAVYNVDPQTGKVIEREGFQRYEYNQQGQLIKVYDTWSTTERLEREYTYDGKNNPLEGLYIAPNIILGNDQSITVFFSLDFRYGQQNNIITSSLYNSDGSIFQTITYSYEYNEMGYPTSATTDDDYEGSYTYDCL